MQELLGQDPGEASACIPVMALWPQITLEQTAPKPGELKPASTGWSQT